MTVSTAKVRGGKKSYYESELEETPEGYYLGERISLNKFFGQGARQWGLDEQVIAADNHAFHALFGGKNPQTGEPLIRGTKTERVYQQGQETTHHKSVRALDLTFSPPKSVSIVEALSWATGDTHTAKTVWQCHERAVRETLKYVEKKLLFTRTGAGGRYRERIDGVFALIHHNTSRPVSASRHPDPQLHTHVLLFNAGIRSDGTTGAIDAWPLFRSHHRLGAIYHRKLQQELHQHLGFTFRQVKLEKGWCFEIKGVPQALIREFSQRRLEIEKKLTGQESSKQVRKEVLATRKAKVEGLDRTTLLASWLETAHRHNFDVQALVRGRAQKMTASQNRQLPETKPTTNSSPVLDGSTYQSNEDAKVQPHSIKPLGGSTRLTKDAFVVTRRLIRTPKPSVSRTPYTSRKAQRLKQKFLWLYATGKISRATYLRVVEGRGLPKSRLGIDFAYATYRISQAQRLYLYHKHGYGLPKGAPTGIVSINLAYATRQITAGQRLYLLHRHKRLTKPPDVKRSPELKRLFQHMVQKRQQAPLPKRSRDRPSILSHINRLRSQKQIQQNRKLRLQP